MCIQFNVQKFPPKNIFISRKDYSFCDQILQVVAILDKKLKIFIFIFFFFFFFFFQFFFRDIFHLAVAFQRYQIYEIFFVVRKICAMNKKSNLRS